MDLASTFTSGEVDATGFEGWRWWRPWGIQTLPLWPALHTAVFPSTFPLLGLTDGQWGGLGDHGWGRNHALRLPRMAVVVSGGRRGVARTVVASVGDVKFHGRPSILRVVDIEIRVTFHRHCLFPMKSYVSWRGVEQGPVHPGVVLGETLGVLFMVSEVVHGCLSSSTCESHGPNDPGHRKEGETFGQK